MDARLSSRIPTLVSLFILSPLGFYTRFYGGPGSAWVQDYLGGILYEVFWCLMAFLIAPGARPQAIAGGVFVATSVLEALQLWHPPFLSALRGSFLGQVVLGTSFDGWDFLYYAVGCAGGWMWITRLKGRLNEVS